MRERSGTPRGRAWAVTEARFRLVTLGAALGWLAYVLLTTFLVH